MKSRDVVLPDLTQWISLIRTFVIVFLDNKNNFDALIIYDFLNTLLCALCQFLLQILNLIPNGLDASVKCLQYWIPKRKHVVVVTTLLEAAHQAGLRVPRLADDEGPRPPSLLRIQAVSAVLYPVPRTQSGTRGWFIFVNTAPGQPGSNETQTQQREYY